MKPVADVALLLEGTYPFVRGGVSSWVHQILSGLPDVSFALIFIGGRGVDYGELHYELPENVVHLEMHYLEDAFKIERGRSRARPEHLADTQSLHEFLQVSAGRKTCPAGALACLEESVDAVLRVLEVKGGVSIDDFLTHPLAWEQIRNAHLEGDANASFVDYFWSLRLIHAPLFQLARIASTVARARAYHTISTGYAGFLGALLAPRRKRPLILTEHGIYTKERRIELNHVEWFDTLHTGGEIPVLGTTAGLRELWIHAFESMGRLTYRSANPIISLYAGNRARQLQDGAVPERTRLIVNGIDTQRFRGALAQRPKDVPLVVGLIGRVVPIKDVKTFIRTMRHVINALPDAQGWIIGSTEEDEAYGEECKALTRSLGIEDGVRFLGHQNVLDILPKLGVLMLTSISEAQPLAILEAFAAGVPCVATDVGACREQIEGVTPEDRALGLAGRVVPFADAEALAQAATELLSSPATWRACQGAALERVARHYTQEAMLAAYRDVYREALEA